MEAQPEAWSTGRHGDAKSRGLGLDLQLEEGTNAGKSEKSKNRNPALPDQKRADTMPGMQIRTIALVAAALASLSVGCKGSPASPFDRLKDSPITVYRLQNWEPPQATAAATPAIPGASMIPGLPPEIQTWISQGAQGMGSLIPPGLLPPGLIPGTATPGATPAALPADAPRFEGFRIIQQSQVMDQKIRDQIIDLVGYESSFETKSSNCLYPELGMSFAGGTPPADVLVSFSCKQVQARNFQWPFPENGLKKDTVDKFQSMTQQLFGGYGGS